MFKQQKPIDLSDFLALYALLAHCCGHKRDACASLCGQLRSRQQGAGTSGTLALAFAVNDARASRGVNDARASRGLWQQGIAARSGHFAELVFVL